MVIIAQNKNHHFFVNPEEVDYVYVKQATVDNKTLYQVIIVFKSNRWHCYGDYSTQQMAEGIRSGVFLALQDILSGKGEPNGIFSMPEDVSEPSPEVN